MNNPLRHVGQTAHPEATPKPSPDGTPDGAGAPASTEADGTLEQHPRTTGATTPGQPAGPRGAEKKIDDLKPGEPPPESSAGS
jgi:hypothetical protein